MKLLLKILLCILSMIITAGETQSFAVLNHSQKEISASLFQSYDYSARQMEPALGRFTTMDPMCESYYDWSPYAYVNNNPMKYVDPTGMMTDWYLNLYKGQIEYIQGNKDLFDQALIHLAADDAKVSEIEDALTEKGYDFEKDPSVEGGYSVDTREQYQGWKMMQVFSPENVATIFFMAGEFGVARGNIKGAGSFSKGIVGLFGKEAARGGFDAARAFKNAISPFKGGNLTNAGRAVTKHPEYFGFESTEALMTVYRSPSALNNLGSSTLKNILRNGVRTTGAGGRYPNGWVTYTLPNGNAASWGLDGTFIGFRGIR